MLFPFLTTSATVKRAAPLNVAGLAVRRVRQLALSSLVKGSSLAVLDQAVVSGTSFATAALLARCSSPDELGIYYLALSVVLFARGIQEQLVAAPYMIYCNRKSGHELAEYAGSALLHQCVVMAVTVVVLIMAVSTGLAPAGIAGALRLLMLVTPVLLFREFARQLSFAHLDLRRAFALDAAAAVLQLGILVTLAAAGRLTVLATLATLAIASGLPAIGWLATCQRRMVGRLSAALRDFAHNWSFARWALASQLLASSAPYVMPWIVAASHGEAETGLLGACNTLVGLSNTFLMGLCNFLTPRATRAYAEGGAGELHSILKQTALLFTTTLGLIAAAAFLFGEQAATFVFGPQFSGAGPIITVLSLGVLANSFGVMAGNGLWAMERPSANLLADACSLVVVIAASVFLVPLWGPLGAAWATCVGVSTDAVIRLWMLHRTMRACDQEAAQ